MSGLAEIALDGLDEIVDAGAEAVELGIVEAEADALREVAGDRRIDHLAEGALQRLHHVRAFGPPELLVLPLFLGHLAHAEAVLAEHFDRTRHRADLVAALSALDFDLEVALRHFSHRAGKSRDGLGDRAREQPAGEPGGKERHRADDENDRAEPRDRREDLGGVHHRDESPALVVGDIDRCRRGEHGLAAEVGRRGLARGHRSRLP